MRRTELKETSYCDHCGNEGYVTQCMGCEKEHCWKCRETEGVEYKHAVHLSGSGDGYYCLKCDGELTANGVDKRHAAYRQIAALRDEENSWYADFKKRAKDAENILASVGHND